MTRQDKTLYQQIHPAKLATDWGASLIGFYLLWQQLIPGLLVTFVPAIIATSIIVRYADLEKLQRSAFGAYVKGYMTPAMQVVRSAGAVMMAVGAWDISFYRLVQHDVEVRKTIEDGLTTTRYLTPYGTLTCRDRLADELREAAGTGARVLLRPGDRLRSSCRRFVPVSRQFLTGDAK